MTTGRINQVTIVRRNSGRPPPQRGGDRSVFSTSTTANSWLRPLTARPAGPGSPRSGVRLSLCVPQGAVGTTRDPPGGFGSAYAPKEETRPRWVFPKNREPPAGGIPKLLVV